MTQFRHAFSLDKQELNEMAPPGTVTLMGESCINEHGNDNTLTIENRPRTRQNKYGPS